MKIYINREYVSGPWGGGAKPLGRLIAMLKTRGHDVYFELRNKKYDVYVCWDPRPSGRGAWYGTINDHRQKFGGKILQRVGDVGTHGKPDLTNLVKCSTVYSDHVLFVSNWAYDYIGREAIDVNNVSVVENGPLEQFFKFRNKENMPSNKLRVVTHHWSNNQKKGFDIYKRIDELNSTLDFFMTSQFEFNQQISSHQHPDSFHQLLGLLAGSNPLAINAGKNLPSFELLSSGIKCSAEELIAKQDNIMTKLKGVVSQINSTEIFGANQAGSKSIFSN